MPSSSNYFGFSIDPAWPWSIPGVGLLALLVVALTLVILTLWTYRGMRRASAGRIFLLILVRLAALLVACVAVLRPSVAFRDELSVPSVLLVVVDDSMSMSIQDQHDNQSRWDYARSILKQCEPQFRQLREEHQVAVVSYRFAADVSEYNPEGQADGKRTDFGEMLNSLYERHGSERYLRGLLILSDGADNGARYPALSLAPKWRALPCPIHTFAFGKTTTTAKQQDISFTSIKHDPSPTVAIKGELRVKGIADAPGFEGRTVHARLFLDDREVGSQDIKLVKTIGNEVEIKCDAPASPGEIKVTLKIDPLPGELTSANNEISTFVTVTKEGISVLYVEGKYRAWEPKFIRYALSQEPSIRLFEAVRLKDDAPGAGESDLFNFDKQHYDVIILGDISASRFSGGNPETIARVKKQVFEKGVGLMMIGGYESFGNSDWDKSELAGLLPVRLDAVGQIDTPVQMVPTNEGLRHYVLRLADREADNATLWGRLPKLNGMTRLGQPKAGATILAESPSRVPILVSEEYGRGRTLAFAGDTTWFWRHGEEWLAKRDQADGNVLILPDTRRLPAGGKLGFAVKLRGKGSVEIPEKDAHFEVKVTGPEKTEIRVPTAREHGDERGTFWKTDVPGEYVIEARGWGTDIDGKPLENLAPAKARFMVYQDDAEMARQAADHEFLAKLANMGGGTLHQPHELKQFLSELGGQPLPQSKPKTKLWPDWRRNPSSRGLGDQLLALSGSGILACFLLFVTLLCLEWFLRRAWGYV